MASRKHKDDPRQQTLAATWAEQEAERRALIRGALIQIKRTKPAMIAELETIVWYLDRYSGDGGCGATAHTLAAHCGRSVRGGAGVPITERTLERRLRFLRLHGIIHQWWDAGRVRRRVDWDRVRGLAIPSTAAAPKKVAEGSAKVAEGSAKMAERHYKEVLASSCATSSSPSVPHCPGGPGPSQRDGKHAGEGDLFFGWLEGELRTRGVIAVDLAIRTIRERKLAPAFVRAAIEHYDREAPAWRSGALLVCFRRAVPGDEPTAERLWPQPSAEKLRLNRVAKFVEHASWQDEQRAEERRRQATYARQVADREARLGGVLDALTPADFDKLAGRVFKTPTERSFFARDLAVWPISRRDLRELLLAQLDQLQPMEVL